MARQLKVPIGFMADLPFGPVPQQGCPLALCSHQESRGIKLCDGNFAHDVILDVVLQQEVVEASDLTRHTVVNSVPSQTPARTCGGEDNYSNNDARSLAELGRDYNGHIDVIEDELCAVEGLKGRQAQAKRGRSAGARFCWKPAMGDDTAGAAKTTSASRAWRKTAKWLGNVLHTKRGSNADTAMWKVRFYRHPNLTPPKPPWSSG